MRTGPGLIFDPGCEPALCSQFDPVDPSEECLASCKNLATPRLRPGEDPPRPASGSCNGKTFVQCVAANDWDFGANSPVALHLPGGPTVLVQPGKDGALYMFDNAHLGTLYDRRQITDLCGASNDPCELDWAGMIVDQVPVVGSVEGTPVLVVPTFISDKTHPAGLVALKVTVDDRGPNFKPFWNAPNRSSKEAVTRFRSPPTKAVIAKFNGEEIVWVAEGSGPRGAIMGVRLADGRVVATSQTEGAIIPYVQPLIHNGTIYLPTRSPAGGAWLEAYEIRAGKGKSAEGAP